MACCEYYQRKVPEITGRLYLGGVFSKSCGQEIRAQRLRRYLLHGRLRQFGASDGRRLEFLAELQHAEETQHRNKRRQSLQAISLGAHARWFEPFLIFVRGIDKNHSGVPIKTGIDPHVVTTKGMPDQYIWRERLRFL